MPVTNSLSAPRLYSGLATLLLSPSEVSSLHAYQKVTLERLQRLYPRTPSNKVYFLSGTLPAPAILHMKQLGLLLMITMLGPNNILWKHGIHMLHHSVKESWFTQVRNLAIQYFLQDTLLTLVFPPSSKSSWKTQVRTAITAYWHRNLKAEASNLPSLRFLRPPPSFLWARAPIPFGLPVAPLLLHGDSMSKVRERRSTSKSGFFL